MNSPPVTFPCPLCSKRMGVPAELLGRQVRCPHCKNVVVAPANAAGPAPVVVSAPPPPPPLDLPTLNLPARKEGADSILSDANESDDEVFGSNPGGRVRTLPPLEPPPAQPDAAAGPGRAEKPVPAGNTFDLPPHLKPPAPPPPDQVLRELPDPFADSEPPPPPNPPPPAPKPAPQPVLPTPVPVPGLPSPSPSGASNPFAGFESAPTPPGPLALDDPPRPAPRRERAPEPDDDDRRPARGRNRGLEKPASGGGKTLFIVLLLCYSAAATGAAVYAFFFKDLGHPLANIPDSFGEFDPVQRKKVGKLTAPGDAPLPPGQRVALNGKLTVGQLEVTPEKVTKRLLVIDTETDKGKTREWTRNPALVMVLDIKNRSPDLPIFPMDPAFTRRESENDRPLTRLVVGRKAYFGGEIDWPPLGGAKRKREAQQANDAVPLKPGESRQYVVFTAANADLVKDAEKAADPLQWRVHLRHGLVEYKGRDVPVTTVIGVDFDAKDITAG